MLELGIRLALTYPYYHVFLGVVLTKTKIVFPGTLVVG